MIEIIKEQVEIPSLNERRFQTVCENFPKKWEVIDTHNEKSRYKGTYEMVMIACHSLNKKFYRDGVVQ